MFTRILTIFRTALGMFKKGLKCKKIKKAEKASGEFDKDTLSAGTCSEQAEWAGMTDYGL
ncbi:hypothetical protein [Fibrobacter sp. UWB11]|uniref:hypothetical protein n=1 Tax=Fibrobacter sp. UWB11 TaxID=1896202 RepID=UPI00111533A6|nr:hypothetical protein [Fibrobacter sp. UWB11]